MRIEPNLYLIGSGQSGFDLTDRYDCNIYLFDAGDSYVIFDAGAGLGTVQILAICAQDEIDLQRPVHLFLTHAHTDHSGGAAHLAEQLPMLQLYAGPETAAIVRTANEAAVSLPLARESGMYPLDYHYRACPVDHIVTAGQPLQIGALTIEPIATPGHSHDHYSYVVAGINRKRYLIAGDAIFFGGKIVLQHTYDCSVPQSIATIQQLQILAFDALLPGHLNFSLQNGKRHIELACATIAHMGCPPSIG
ncbi:MAG TPA: MBL fold metallo-hydrolase [Caldilineaceae bacterium]|nr:MBL fold metallo-hydrolase [Caldilineaceae bacterium]